MIPSPTGWLAGLLTWLGAVFVFLATLLSSGCAPQATEIERVLMYTAEHVIKPAVEKATDETTVRTASLQGGLQAINPGYVIHFEGYWKTGVDGEISVKTDGVAGQVTGHVQTDAGQAATVSPPANREGSTELSGPPTSTAPGG